MRSRFGMVIGMLLVLTLVFLAGIFLVFLFEEGDAFEYVLLGLLALGGLSWIAFRGPIGKAIASLLEGGSHEGDSMTSARLAEVEGRLQEISLEMQRFVEIEERLDFTERLLTQASEPQVREDQGR
jgi:hypothetical protein